MQSAAEEIFGFSDHAERSAMETACEYADVQQAEEFLIIGYRGD